MSLSTESIGRYITIHDEWLVRSQTYGYLPCRSALPLLLNWHSLPIPPKAGSSDGLSGWIHTIHTKMAYIQYDISLLTGLDVK